MSFVFTAITPPYYHPHPYSIPPQGKQFKILNDHPFCHRGYGCIIPHPHSTPPTGDKNPKPKISPGVCYTLCHIGNTCTWLSFRSFYLRRDVTAAAPLWTTTCRTGESCCRRRRRPHAFMPTTRCILLRPKASTHSDGAVHSQTGFLPPVWYGETSPGCTIKYVCTAAAAVLRFLRHRPGLSSASLCPVRRYSVLSRTS